MQREMAHAREASEGALVLTRTSAREGGNDGVKKHERVCEARCRSTSIEVVLYRSSSPWFSSEAT